MTREDYINKLTKKLNKSQDDFRIHFITFIAVNLGLFLLNMMTSAGHPWFLYVLGGWGIGLASHWGDFFYYKKELEELDNWDDLEKAFKFNKLRKNFFIHCISNIAVALYLLMINIITSPWFLWALIPSAGMAIGMASHWAAYTNKVNRIDTPDFKPTPSPGSENSHLEKALKLKESTLSVITEVSAKFRGFPQEILVVIDEYVETVKLLSLKEADLDKALEEINRAEIVEEIKELNEKIDAGVSGTLQFEYNKHIDELNTQLSTIEKLEEEREILSLKVASAINNLKQLNLELISIKSKTTFEDRSIIDNFERKSKELSLYYKDLMDSYDEVFK